MASEGRQELASSVRLVALGTFPAALLFLGVHGLGHFVSNVFQLFGHMSTIFTSDFMVP
jgi:hypothetical protein